MAFFLFLLVNATLFLRPAEVFAVRELENVYQYLILACLFCAVPDVLNNSTSRPLDAQPITVCVFGILLAVPLAFLAIGDLAEAFRTWFYFFKVVVYFVLLVSLVNTPTRMRVFINSLLVFSLGLTLITLLQFLGVVQLDTLKKSLDTTVDAVTGEAVYFTRLTGSGIFHDPNELGVMLATMAPLCLFALMQKTAGGLRILWIAEFLAFGFAIAKTQSRGALLAFGAGLGTLVWAKFGWRRAVLLGLLGLPVLPFLFTERQIAISASSNTGQSRVQLWSDWMMEFRDNPLLGKGVYVGKDEPETERAPGIELKHLAHNSYLQAFADMGLPGGVLFLGAFFLAISSIWRLRPSGAVTAEGGHPFAPTEGDDVEGETEMQRLQPYLLGAVAAYAVGLMTLSLCYVVPTYLVLGLAAAYANLAYLRAPESDSTPRLDMKIVGRFAALSVGFLAVMYVFVRVFIRWA
ncbi:MAG: O-antigen ligase family protein [Gemmataceae bacterium]|nr:O-antigen ligase family protein [Gemmataceae bacterium]MCI0739262.1 O-antigen ligase family protein [Gemmataceae bacterium]